MNKYFIAILFFLGFANWVQAQILPPDFHCIKGDTLFWQAPVNTCGPFVDYEIYFSNTRNGPYTLAGRISVLTITTYFHPNPTKELRYYYLIARHVCPGQTTLSSDTLDNRPPEISPLKSVSVDSNKVILSWQASPSPEVHAYVIYRETAIGVVPVDTVFGKTSYTDNQADPNKKTESYFVNAIDKCGNTSIFDSKHTTMFMEASVSACEQTVDLKWNRYQNWNKGIARQEIWAGINGSSPTKRDSVPASLSTYRFKNVVDGSTYCFFLRAEENETGAVSKSNQVCITVKVVRPVKDHYIRNVTVNAFGEVEITWNWDTSAEIKKAEVMRSDQNSGYQVLQNLNLPGALAPTMTFTDKTSNPDKGEVFYKIRTTDLCDTVAFSSYGATVFLTGAVQPTGDNYLSWTPFELQHATTTGYEVYRILKTNETRIASLPATNRNNADPFDPSVAGQTEACYYIVAIASLQVPGGGIVTVNSRSNVFCMEQTLGIYIPNAFAPNGINTTFLPYIVPQDFSYFEMKILDRYGNELYFTTDASAGWDGTLNGKIVPTGVYIYRIQVKRPNGKTVLRSGSLNLLR